MRSPPIAAYDAAIATGFDAPSPDAKDELPIGLHLSLAAAQTLRYGENPHQQGARYRFDGATSWWDTAVQHQGKELSYLNLYDTEAAWKLVHRFGRPACVVVKHATRAEWPWPTPSKRPTRWPTPCDPVSAFGGIVALNRPVPAALAEALGAVFTEVVVAPSFDPAALGRVRQEGQPAGAVGQHTLTGGARHPLDRRRVSWCSRPTRSRPTVRTGRWVTKEQPTPNSGPTSSFAWQVCAVVSSNAIVYAKDGQAYGIGAGQQNRLDSARIGRRPCGRPRCGGGVCQRRFLPVPRRSRRRPLLRVSRP